MNTATPATRLLIADDSDITRMTLARILQDGRELREAANGEECLAVYRAFRPDIILLDLNMPERDGMSVIREIRSHHADHDTFIIVLTGEGSPEVLSISLNAGANDFLSKPFGNAELLARIGVAERQTALTRQLRGYTQRIREEIELVASLQQKLLPSHSPLFPGVRIETIYRPSGHASGDFYDYFALPERNTLRTVIADVSGHGARAAFIMSIVRTLFRLTQTRYIPLATTVRLINDHLLDIIGTEEDFVTLFCADIHFNTRTMQYINAGHCPGMLRSAEGAITRLASSTPLLGFFPITPQVQQVPFHFGSRLFLFTDGFFDWQMDNGALFSLPMFWDQAAGCMERPNNFVETLRYRLAMLAGHGGSFRDDVTALWIATGSQHA